MTDIRVLSNKRVTVWIGPDNGLTSYTAPLLTEVAALKNVSEAIRWAGTDFNLAFSALEDDRGLTDEADSKTRSYAQFAGHFTFFTPKPGDTSSISYQTRQLVKVPRTKLVIVIRTVTLNSVGVAAGDVVNTYHVITDSNTHVRGKASYSYTIRMVPQDSVGINAFITPTVAVAVAVTPSTALALAVGGVSRPTASYLGTNVTTQATYATTNSQIASVSEAGVIYGVSAGTATITATMPGSAVGVPKVVTVT